MLYYVILQTFYKCGLEYLDKKFLLMFTRTENKKVYQE